MRQGPERVLAFAATRCTATPNFAFLTVSPHTSPLARTNVAPTFQTPEPNCLLKTPEQPPELEPRANRSNTRN